jgi:hypothetical protein
VRRVRTSSGVASEILYIKLCGIRDIIKIPCGMADICRINYHGTNELVAALKTKKFVLPVGLVEEDHVQGDRVGFIDGGQFSENVLLVLAVLGGNKFKKALAKRINLF